MATHTNEDIIEKRDTSPVATSCIVFATLALLGAIALQVAELREIRADYSAKERNAGVVSRTVTDYDEIERGIDDLLRDTKIADSDRAQNSEIKEGAEGAPGTLGDAARGFDDDDDMTGGDDDDDDMAGDDDDDDFGDDDDDDFGDDDDDDDFGDDDDDDDDF